MSTCDRQPPASAGALVRLAVAGAIGGAGFGFAVGLVVSATTSDVVGWVRWFYVLLFATIGALGALALRRRP